MSPRIPPIFVISGPAGSGKTTTSNIIIDNNLAPAERIITTTSRPPRKNKGIMELDGKDYDFCDREEFERRLEQGLFIEHVDHLWNYYGTPWKRVEEILHRWHVPLSIVETRGAANIVKAFRERYSVLTIFLLPWEEHETWLRWREWMTEQEILARLEKGKEEVQYQDQYDIRLVNNESAKSAITISKIISDAITWRARERICKLYDIFSGVTN